MAKMLGRIALGAFCECCNDNYCTRKSKRREQRQWRRDVGLVEVVRMDPATVPYPVDTEHPPADFDG